MTETSAETPARAPASNATISAICPDDLGLKAGFWSGRETDPLTFRPIVGWVSVTNFVDSALPAFVAVVLNDLAYPAFASAFNFPEFIGVFSKALSSTEARQKMKEWTNRERSEGAAQAGSQLVYDGRFTLTVPPTAPPAVEMPGKKP